MPETKEAVCPIRRDEKEGLSQSGEAEEERDEDIKDDDSPCMLSLIHI